jgi:chromosome segregation ATPase
MTVDERIERLTERHEALAQSVELLRDSVQETSDSVKALAVRFDGLTGIMAQLLGSMKTLADAAADHERRISGLEGAA